MIVPGWSDDLLSEHMSRKYDRSNQILRVFTISSYLDSVSELLVTLNGQVLRWRHLMDLSILFSK